MYHCSKAASERYLQPSHPLKAPPCKQSGIGTMPDLSFEILQHQLPLLDLRKPTHHQALNRQAQQRIGLYPMDTHVPPRTTIGSCTENYVRMGGWNSPEQRQATRTPTTVTIPKSYLSSNRPTITVIPHGIFFYGSSTHEEAPPRCNRLQRRNTPIGISQNTQRANGLARRVLLRTKGRPERFPLPHR